ncbi:biotin-dependent carboxyltransferase family protein [Methylocapsa aurea]|uniref:5-oxoprolinase subunit C family protein n=1 Tax=Methylocapsa aurea TaxID=663610 RepID=UPI00055BDE4C|nr:biotin-dependent carboxyltransferase family protein [Methylocapsa aurea]
MRARLRVLRAGPGATIQDGGRHGFLRFGVTPAGPMDWTAFRTANLTLGNDDRAAALEISAGGLSALCEDAPLAVAFAGGAFIWRRDGVLLPQAARLLLRPGEVLAAQAGSFGAWAYLAVEGGFDAPLDMGSRATHVRSGMGGVEGRMLRQGDVLFADLLPAAARMQSLEASEFDAAIDAPWLARDAEAFRVVLGPQDDYFTAAGLTAFFAEEFTLTPRADRMAYRFEGPEIAHARGHDIVSDGIALGAIQIAGDKKPLVLLADRQPTGGYPKLGHVILADIGRLAQMRPGEACRFAAVGLTEARAALFRLEDEIAATPSLLHPLRREPTSKALIEANLIDGVVNALEGSSQYCDWPN